MFRAVFPLYQFSGRLYEEYKYSKLGKWFHSISFLNYLPCLLSEYFQFLLSAHWHNSWRLKASICIFWPSKPVCRFATGDTKIKRSCNINIIQVINIQLSLASNDLGLIRTNIALCSCIGMVPGNTEDLLVYLPR